MIMIVHFVRPEMFPMRLPLLPGMALEVRANPPHKASISKYQEYQIKGKKWLRRLEFKNHLKQKDCKD